MKTFGLMLRSLVLAALAAFCSCAVPTGPKYGVPNARPVAIPDATTPALLDSVWDSAQACSGIHTTESWARIRWFMVPGENFRYAAGQAPAIGLWTSTHNVYLADAQPSTGVSGEPLSDDTLVYRWELIKHEMVHDLAQTGAHGAPFCSCHLVPVGECR